MGKKQHQKDKMYLTYTEWGQFYGGKKAENLENEHIKFKRLPFDYCCITHIPFDIPYMDPDGNIYELEAIANFLKHFKKSPITGSSLDAKSLIKLNFARNTNDDSDDTVRFQCPALFKPFTKNSHIVAIATTGNVFCYEAIEQLNIKTKNWKDLVNDQPFTRKDIITIQDPSKLEKFDISQFYFIKNKLRVETDEDRAMKKDPKGRIQKMSIELKETLEELEATYKEKEKETAEDKKVPDKFNAAHYSTGKVAASFTSTAIAPSVKTEADIVEEDLVRYERVKKKGYIRLNTNFGSLNLELFCDQVPKTCENFLKHCADGYYNGTKFHRSIRNFMIQGGDPTSKTGECTGRGGSSIWNTKFEDEFKPGLSHTGRGVLSMANSGPNSNGSQFFITFRSCKHLDGKHTIFGKLVGGLETLTDMERVEVDNKDQPIEDIIIQSAQIFVDPYQEADEQLAAERQAEVDKIQKEKDEIESKKLAAKKQPLKAYRDGVGKYLTKLTTKPEATSSGEPTAKKKKNSNYTFDNFKSW
ncbi:CLUMA_CG021222, isoform A [Clunio marinus]|uniref:CLUMA_CG021222, isoform A n=1 Tax=Clunio marinus TaxID=568069 RepID=A0A1J1J8A5_9DIPT|nr:CLUMA_CG021222, isoform A [Clunio marinus]